MTQEEIDATRLRWAEETAALRRELAGEQRDLVRVAIDSLLFERQEHETTKGWASHYWDLYEAERKENERLRDGIRDAMERLLATRGPEVFVPDVYRELMTLYLPILADGLKPPDSEEIVRRTKDATDNDTEEPSA